MLVEFENSFGERDIICGSFIRYWNTSGKNFCYESSSFNWFIYLDISR